MKTNLSGSAYVGAISEFMDANNTLKATAETKRTGIGPRPSKGGLKKLISTRDYLSPSKDMGPKVLW